MRHLVAAWLFLVPLTAALGSYLFRIPLGGVALFGFRLLVLFGAFALLSSGKLSLPRLHTLPGQFIAATLVWVFWATLSLYWTPDPVRGIVETLAVAFGATALLTAANFARMRIDATGLVRDGWVVAYIAAVAISAWEFSTGNHLPGDYIRRLPDYARTRWLTTSSFDNPNNYAAFVVVAVPFLYWRMLISKAALRPLFGLVLITGPFITVLTGARIAMAALLVQTAVIVITTLTVAGYRRLARRILQVGLGMSAALAALGVAVAVRPDVVQQILAVRSGISAVEGRFNLTLTGISFFANSFGFGVGAGGYTGMLSAGRGTYATGSLVDPHNMWIEILAQYGLIVIVPLLFALGRALLLGIRASQTAGEEGDSAKEGRVLLLLLIGYVFAAMENSSYIAQSVNWAVLITVLILARSVHERLRLATRGQADSQPHGRGRGA